MARLLVIVSYRIFPAHLGGQKGIAKFYHHLQQHHSIHMVVSRNNNPEQLPFAVEKILYPNNRIGLNIFQLPRLRKIIRENNIDGIVAEHSYTGWMAWLLTKMTGRTFFIHSHNIETARFQQMNKKGWRFFRHYEKWIHQKADFSFFKTDEEQNWAQQNFHLQSSKTAVIPYGVEEFCPIANARQQLKERYKINSPFVFYFNGTLDYAPNTEAVEHLLDTINPMLQETTLAYTIVISGKRLNPALEEKVLAAKNMQYLGFVNDATLLYQSATLFLNPVLNDTGIKTKVVEALANHCTVISAASGATGIPKRICAGKLKTVQDGNWKAFVQLIEESCKEQPADTPPAFFDYFSWKKIVQTAATKINYTLAHA